MVAAHLGVIDEDKINDMSYVFFEDVLEEIGYKLNYDAVVNYAGNSFCEKSWQMINDSNPFNIKKDQDKTNSQAMNALANFFNKGNIRIKGET